MAWENRAHIRLSHADLLELYLHLPDNFERLAVGLGFEKKKIEKDETAEGAKPIFKQPDNTDNPPIEPIVISSVSDRPEIPFFMSPGVSAQQIILIQLNQKFPNGSKMLSRLQKMKSTIKMLLSLKYKH